MLEDSADELLYLASFDEASFELAEEEGASSDAVHPAMHSTYSALYNVCTTLGGVSRSDDLRLPVPRDDDEIVSVAAAAAGVTPPAELAAVAMRPPRRSLPWHSVLGWGLLAASLIHRGATSCDRRARQAAASAGTVGVCAAGAALCYVACGRAASSSSGAHVRLGGAPPAVAAAAAAAEPSLSLLTDAATRLLRRLDVLRKEARRVRAAIERAERVVSGSPAAASGIGGELSPSAPCAALRLSHRRATTGAERALAQLSEALRRCGGRYASAAAPQLRGGGGGGVSFAAIAADAAAALGDAAATLGQGAAATRARTRSTPLRCEGERGRVIALVALRRDARALDRAAKEPMIELLRAVAAACTASSLSAVLGGECDGAAILRRSLAQRCDACSEDVRGVSAALRIARDIDADPNEGGGGGDDGGIAAAAADDAEQHAQRTALRQLVRAARMLRLRARDDATLLLICQQRAVAMLEPELNAARCGEEDLMRQRTKKWGELAASLNAALDRGSNASGGLALHADLSRELAHSAAALVAVVPHGCAEELRVRFAPPAVDAPTAPDSAFVSTDEALVFAPRPPEKMSLHGAFETETLALARRAGGRGSSGGTEVLEAYTGPLVVPVRKPRSAQRRRRPAPSSSRGSMHGVFGELQQALRAMEPAKERTRQLGDDVDGDDDDALVADSLARRRLAGAHHAAVMSELQHAIVSAAH